MFERCKGGVATGIRCVVAIGLWLLFSVASANPPPLQSGQGITVHNAWWLPGSSRTLVVDISTSSVDGNVAVHGNHEVRITLPEGYFSNPDLQYPVLYLLHGGDGGSSRQWTSEGGIAESLTSGTPLITVMPDGGKVGWYTNWVNQSAGAQSWEDFHLYQLIPWVDNNLRTIVAKQGRAIAGLSMGGFGAIHYAQQRPDLFAYAASFSGALNLDNAGIRSVVTEQALQNGLPADGPFGFPVFGQDGAWIANNPVPRASDLAGVSVALYAGTGINDQDVLERTVGWTTHEMHTALDQAGIGHFFQIYGWRPGNLGPFGCDGGHNFTCWNYALNDVLPRMMQVLSGPQTGGGNPNTPSGAIGDKYNEIGGAASVLGAPISPELDAQLGGRYQRFENGIILWHADTGAQPVHGRILAHFEATGVEGTWGFPTMAESNAAASPVTGSVGRYQYFQNGLFLWSPQTDAHVVHGAIHQYFADHGRELEFGYPVTDEESYNGGVRQVFERATFYWTPQQGVWVQYQ